MRVRICSPLGRNRRLRSERVRVRPSCPPCAFEMYASKMQPQPRRAASIAAMSIFFICIIASNARLAAAVSGSVTALVRAIGVICQDNPHLSLHQPHALSSPPLPRNRRWGNRVRDLDQRVSLPLRRAQTGEQAQAARQRARLLVHYRNSSTKLMIRQPPDRRFEPSGARQTDRGVCPTWLVVNWTSLDRRARYETLNNWNFNSSGISVLLLGSKALPERRRKSMLPSQVYRSKFKSSKRKSGLPSYFGSTAPCG